MPKALSSVKFNPSLRRALRDERPPRPHSPHLGSGRKDMQVPQLLPLSLRRQAQSRHRAVTTCASSPQAPGISRS